MWSAPEPLSTAAQRRALATAVAVVAAGIVGLVTVHPDPAPRPAPRVAAPDHEVCPTGSLTWTVTTFAVVADPLNPHNLKVTETGTVRDDTDADITLQAPEGAVSAPPAAGSTTYPIYLTLDNDDLYPGQVGFFTGTSPEVGVASVARGPLTYQASWDNPAFARCPLPAHRGAP